MNDIHFTTEALQGQALAETIKRLDTMYEILVGNGHPTAGLATQFALLQRDVETIKAAQQQNETTRAAQLAELKAMLTVAHRANRQIRGWVIPLLQLLLSAVIGGLVALMLEGWLVGR